MISQYNLRMAEIQVLNVFAVWKQYKMICDKKIFVKMLLCCIQSYLHYHTNRLSDHIGSLQYAGSGLVLMLFHSPLGQSLHILSTRLLLSTLQPAQPGTSSHRPDLWICSRQGLAPLQLYQVCSSNNNIQMHRKAYSLCLSFLLLPSHALKQDIFWLSKSGL